MLTSGSVRADTGGMIGLRRAAGAAAVAAALLAGAACASASAEDLSALCDAHKSVNAEIAVYVAAKMPGVGGAEWNAIDRALNELVRQGLLSDDGELSAAARTARTGWADARNAAETQTLRTTSVKDGSYLPSAAAANEQRVQDWRTAIQGVSDALDKIESACA